MTYLTTERLILRQWQPSDIEPCIEMNADAETMRYFPSVLSPETTREHLARWSGLIDQYGWGLFAVESRETGEFVGTVGLVQTRDNMPFDPCVEIGWRLRREFWNQGFATEATTEVLRFAYSDLGLSRVISITAKINVPSQRVMEKIGLVDSGQDFMHPSIDARHELALHVLYETPA
ncbi:MAG TPA: GNAT family N-acetyltransferase [Fimbriimonas sp.]|nr:GNAT family N-acetyltransferase [Fimbriimonas sp.]